MNNTTKHSDESKRQVKVSFHPQVWRDNRALTGDPIEFTVPREDAVNAEGDLYENNSAESDQLRNHENAPEKAQKWQGPFYVTIKDPSK